MPITQWALDAGRGVASGCGLVRVGWLSLAVALSCLPFGPPAAAQAPQGYHIVMTPSGLPYVAPPGGVAPGRAAVWAYQGQWPAAAAPAAKPAGLETEEADAYATRRGRRRGQAAGEIRARLADRHSLQQLFILKELIERPVGLRDQEL